MHLTIRHKLFSGFAAVLLVLGTAIGISYTRIIEIDRIYGNVVDEEVRLFIQVQQLNVIVKQEQVSLRGYLISGEEDAVQDFQRAHAAYTELSKQMGDGSYEGEAKEMLRELNYYEEEYYHLAQRAVQMKKMNNEDALSELIATQGNAIIRGFDRAAEQFANTQQQALDENTRNAGRKVEAVRSLIVQLSLAALIVAILLSWYIGRKMTQPILAIVQAARMVASGNLSSPDVTIPNKDEFGELAASFNAMSHNLRRLIVHTASNSNHVAASAEQLTATSEQTALGAEQISAAMLQVAGDTDKQHRQIGQISSSIGDMRSGMLQMAEHASDASSSATQAYQRASDGNVAITQATDQMVSIHQSVEELRRLIHQLHGRSAEIGDIVSAMAGIASQTGLLALNAAIEAAHAGEHGRGFAVVAGEIRKLAEQSNQSAGQIASLIAAIQQEMGAAVQSTGSAAREAVAGLDAVHTAGEAFAHIQSTVYEVNERIEEVSQSARLMAGGVRGIVGNMQEVTKAAEATLSGTQEVSASAEEQLASMEEVSASAHSLARLAEQLQGQISQFKV